MQSSTVKPMAGKQSRPRVTNRSTYGNPSNFWVEYPSGLIDVTREHANYAPEDKSSSPQDPAAQELDLDVQGDRLLRVSTAKTAMVIIDMQNFFLHPDLRAHPLGLDCVKPLHRIIPHLRSMGTRIICNWGLTDAELNTIPPSLARSFSLAKGGFGSPLKGNFGRLLMRGEYNSELYDSLQELYMQGKEQGTDVWIHKNRMSGIWGPQSELDLYLQSQGLTSILFAGVNADQCVLGSVVDAYFKGYDCILVEDCIATTSPSGAKENLVFNSLHSYGFVTDSESVVSSISRREQKGRDARGT